MMAKKGVESAIRDAWATVREAVFKAAVPEGETLPDMDAVAAAFHDEFGEIADTIQANGVDVGEKKIASKAKKLSDDLEKVKAERDKAFADLDEAHSKAPDAEKLKKDFQRQMDKAVSERDERLQSLSGQLSEMREERDLGSFEKGLVEAGFKPRAAQSYKEIYRKNFKYDDDGNLQVLQPDTDTPYLSSGRGRAYDPLITKLKKEADPDDIIAKADTNGSGGVRPGYGNRSSVPRTVQAYDPRRDYENAEERAEAMKAERDRLSAERAVAERNAMMGL